MTLLTSFRLSKVSLRPSLLFIFLILCVFTGGSSRDDVAGLLVLYPGAILIATAALLLRGSFRWRDMWVLLIFLISFAIWMIIQIIPFPSAIWLELPKRDIIIRGADLAGVTLTWRPISLAPDLTLASLVYLSVPLSALILTASVPRLQIHRLVWFLLCMGLLSSVLGVAQVAGGADSAFYFFASGSKMDTTGLFSNRNHHALLLAMMFPLTAVTIDRWPATSLRPRWRLAIAGGAAIFWMVMLLMAGSRAGLLMGFVALTLSALFIMRPFYSFELGRYRSAHWLAMIGIIVLISAVIVVFHTNLPSVDRMISGNIGDELRLQSLPVLTKMIASFWLLGTGFGTFDPVYRIFEPDRLLADTYLNHAHNDLIELLITGGIFPTIMVCTFAVYTACKMFGCLRDRSSSSDAIYARVATILIFLIGISSLIDYPLRTPLITVILVISYSWLNFSTSRAIKKALR